MTGQPDDLVALENRLGYCFQEKQLLQRSLTHPSYLVTEPNAAHNQRLEFLGDAVLGLILAEVLFEEFPDEREGLLTRSRSMLANGEQLSRLASDIELGSFLRIGEAEESQGGRGRESILEDAMEAVIGAIYLDGGYGEAAKVVRKLYGSIKDRLDQQEASHNPKGRLQELLQPTLGNEAIDYRVIDISGPDHQREFKVEVWVQDQAMGSGTGGSKKVAEEEAAREALEALKSDSDS